MTLEQWKLLRVGDVVIDLHAQRARRTIYAISIVRTHIGTTRYCLRVTNVKSRRKDATTIIFCSDNTGPSRFELP